MDPQLTSAAMRQPGSGSEPKLEPDPGPEPEPEPESEPEPSARPLYSPVALQWRETDEISSAESTPMSTRSASSSWPHGSGERANTPVSLIWRDTADISSAESTPVSVRDTASPNASVQLVWRDTEEISSDDQDDTEGKTESDDDDDDEEEEEEEEDASVGSDDSWYDPHDASAGNVETRVQAEIDARIARELAVRERSLAAARGARDLATEVKSILGQSEQSDLLQRVAPPSEGASAPDKAVWAETAAAMTQLCDGLSARVAAAIAYDPVAIKCVQKQLVDGGRCTLLPGLKEDELTALQHKVGARFPPELRAFLRCGVPVDSEPSETDALERQSEEGWVNWHFLLHRNATRGGDKDILALRRSEWVALLPPDCREQSARYPLVPIFGSHVIPSVPSCNGLPVWTLAVDEATEGGAVSTASSVGSSFWHWLEIQHGIDGLTASIPVEWIAETVPVEKVPFWPQKANGLH